MLKKLLATVSALTLLTAGMTLPAGAAPASEDNILFSDHFDAASDDVWTVSSGNWAVQDGVYHQTDLAGGAMTFAGDSDWVNYEVEVKVTPRAVNGQGVYVMLSGRADGPENRYVGAFSGGELVIDRRIGGKSTLLARKTYTMEVNQDYILKLKFVGSHISLYVNGTLELETDDTTHSEGRIGLATYKTAADFDDVTVRRLTEDVTPPDPDDPGGNPSDDKTLFRDTFETASSDVWAVTNGKWAVQNGVYSQTDMSAGAMTFAGDLNWTDYEVEAKVTAHKTNGGNIYVMISGRADGVQNRYVGSYNGQELLIDRRINSESAILVKKKFTMELDRSYTMKMRFVGSHITLYIDGTAELEVEDSSHAFGKIGLATYKTAADFDDVTVTNLSDEDPSGVSLSVQAPQNYQVIQRNVETENAPVTIGGQVSSGDVVKVEARVLEYDDSSATIRDWTELPLEGNAYSGTLTVPQGGWYRLEVRALGADGTPLKTVTDNRKWGVGINILCVGQSNMVGQGAPPYTVADDLAANFRSGSWQHLADPYDGAGASLVPAMVNKLIENLHLPVGVIPAADSGSGLHEPNVGNAANWYWMYYNTSNPKDSRTLYGRAVTRALAAGGVELAVWNQGETDGRMLVPKETYEADMKELLARFRRDLDNEDLPMFLCQIGTHDTNISHDDAYTAIRSAQQDLDDGQNFFLAATEMEFERKDTAHYKTPGMNEIGRRVANGILYYYGLSEYYRGPSIDAARFADKTCTIIDVNIVHRGGDDITPASGITGFSVLDGETPVTVLSANRLDAHTIRLTLSAAVTNNARVRYLYGLNPDVSHVVKDNTAMQLPLEITGKDIPVTAHEHVWGNWSVVRPATNTEDGLEARQCSLCGEEETRVIPMLHDLLGDINQDNEITASDALLALQAATGKTMLTTDQRNRADVDRDGKVSANDALLILQYATQKINAFPAE